MPTIEVPSDTASEGTASSRSVSERSQDSFRTPEENSSTPMDSKLFSGDYVGDTNMGNVESNQSNMGSESSNIYRDIKGWLDEIRERDRTREVEHKAELDELRQEIRKLSTQEVPQQRLQDLGPTPVAESSQGTMTKFKPLKWPEAYDHKDPSQWTTTHSILCYIYQRDVVEKRLLEPSDFFMNLFSHSVTGAAKNMVTGQFQEMIANGRSTDALGFLRAMDETFRDRNEEKHAAALFYACKQFKDESLASFLPRFQQLLARSPSSSTENKNKIYQLYNSLNQTTRNYLVGRSAPNIFNELVEFLSGVGSQIEEVGLVRTRSYAIGQTGGFDDGTKGIAGGRLLGTAPSLPAYRPKFVAPNNNNKDADGDTKMTGINRVRAQWVSQEELDRRRAAGECLRCGNKSHRIAKCYFLPALRPETAVQILTNVDELTPSETTGNEELKG